MATPGHEPRSRSSTPFHVVGIGASAGGLEALERFFRAVPSDSEFAFVVVQHLSPDHPSLMAELLGRHTALPVSAVTHGVELKPGTVHLIPPGRNLRLVEGRLLLEEPERMRGQNFPINVFFESLAEDVGEKAVGVVLSGTGSDGTLGVRAVKAFGGLVLAQDEASARFDGMPENAIATGMVDFVCKPEEMPELLDRLLARPTRRLEEPPIDTLGDQSSFLKIFMLLRSRTGVDFSSYKLATILRRVKRRMEVNLIDSPERYATHLQSSAQEIDRLFHELLIGVTSFFRDEGVWESLAKDCVPALVQGRASGSPLRVWVPGCSTGEEAYTIAMVFMEALGPRLREFDLKIFATDVDKASLEFAGAGRYPEGIETQVSAERLSRYFVKKGDHYRVAESVRKLVIFAAQNVVGDQPFSRMDLVSCRNLLIYLHPSAQRRVLSTFHFALNPGGMMLLGTSESLGEAGGLFDVVEGKVKLYRAVGKHKGLPLYGGRAAGGLRVPRQEGALGGSEQAFVKEHAGAGGFTVLEGSLRSGGGVRVPTVSAEGMEGAGALGGPVGPGGIGAMGGVPPPSGETGPTGGGLLGNPSLQGYYPGNDRRTMLSPSFPRRSLREEGTRNLEHTLLGLHVPPAVLVDAHGDILHVHADVTPFLRLAPGRASLNVHKVIHPDLAASLGMALARARAEGARVVHHALRLETSQGHIEIDLGVTPAPSPDRGGPAAFSVTFEARPAREEEVPKDAKGSSGESGASAADGGEGGVSTTGATGESEGRRTRRAGGLDGEPTEEAGGFEEAKRRIVDLEWELQNSRENLHAVIEELETSNEELQSTNEELLAANEELQSTNEELQSLNEELHTVNAEYQRRIEELTEAKNDIDNLLKSSDVGLLLLDRGLKLRKFNPAATREFHVLEADLGRPLAHLSTRLDLQEIAAAAQAVFLGSGPRTYEAVTAEGVSWSVRVSPYLEQSGYVAGVVVALIDVTPLKAALNDVKRFSLAMEQGPTQVMFFDEKGRVTFVNRHFERETGYVSSQVLGRDFRFLHDARVASEEDRLLWESLQRAGEWKGELAVRRRDGSLYDESATIGAVRDDDGRVVCYVKVSEDVTRRKTDERELRETRDLLQKIIDTLPQTLAILDEKGNILNVNQSWRGFADDNDFVARDYGLGANYVRVCEFARGQSADGAARVADGLRRIVNGESAEFRHEYPCHSPDEKRWFAMNAHLVSAGDSKRIVVNHDNVTRARLLAAERCLLLTALKLGFTGECAVMVIDFAGSVAYANAPASAAFGDPLPPLTNGWWPGRAGTEAKDEFSLALKRALGTGVPSALKKATIAGKPCEEIEIHPVFDDDQDWLGIVVRLTSEGCATKA